MDAMLAAFEQVAQRVAYQAPKRTVISNLTGEVAQGERGELVSAAYWVKHVRHAVRFADGVHSAVRAGARSFLEVGPQAVLSAMAAACVAEGVDGSLSERVVTVASMRKGQPEAQTLMAALGAVHVGGHRVDWETILEGTGGGRVDLPTYAFQRQRYWLDASASTTVPAARLHAEDPADLATAAASKPEDPSSLRRRLAELPETDRLASLTSLVQEVVAAVLGLAGAAAIPDQRPIKELGMDSLMGVQVRNELSARANVNLPLTLVYNHPTPLAIAKLLLEKLTLARAPTPTWSDSEVRARLSQVSIAALRQQGLLDVLMALPTMPRPTTEEDEELMGAYTAIHDINGDSLLNFAERVLGGSHGK
jgi:acyl transferase domain-containing protein